MLRLNRLTTPELLNHLDSIKYHSPIILELCKRLEEVEDDLNLLTDKVECPVCQAKLLAGTNTMNSFYTLKIDKDT